MDTKSPSVTNSAQNPLLTPSDAADEERLNYFGPNAVNEPTPFIEEGDPSARENAVELLAEYWLP
ncbi:MAG TPA: hypothetical protein VLU73_12150 [Methylococcaceae bacterium]|nr:hypothetical protein [Methylococcaceae bacterium]